MAGRKPKPTALKELEGNPGKRKMNTKEPVPEKEKSQKMRWRSCLGVIADGKGNKAKGLSKAKEL